MSAEEGPYGRLIEDENGSYLEVAPRQYVYVTPPRPTPAGADADPGASVSPAGKAQGKAKGKAKCSQVVSKGVGKNGAKGGQTEVKGGPKGGSKGKGSHKGGSKGGSKGAAKGDTAALKDSSSAAVFRSMGMCGERVQIYHKHGQSSLLFFFLNVFCERVLFSMDSKRSLGFWGS